jgi:hypothetical protein
MHDWNQVASDGLTVIFRDAEGEAVRSHLRECCKRKDCQTQTPECAHDGGVSKEGP